MDIQKDIIITSVSIKLVITVQFFKQSFLNLLKEDCLDFVVEMENF